MPQNRNISVPPKTMTWAKASPIIAVAGIFDLLRMFFEMFWFFGPALAAAYCTSSVNSAIGTTVTATAGKIVATGCVTVAGVTGAALSEMTTVFGIIMAMAVGFLGWLTVGIIIIMSNSRIFKEEAGHSMWFALSLLISEVPFIGALPGLTGITWKMYRTQIKKDKENMKKYEKQLVEMNEQEGIENAVY